MVICNICKKEFENTKQLRGHKIIHKRRSYSGKNHPRYGKNILKKQKERLGLKEFYKK